MTKELRQGLGLLAVAAAIALVWLVVRAPLVSGAAVLFAIGALALVAVGLFKRD